MQGPWSPWESWPCRVARDMRVSLKETACEHCDNGFWLRLLVEVGGGVCCSSTWSVLFSVVSGRETPCGPLERWAQAGCFSDAFGYRRPPRHARSSRVLEVGAGGTFVVPGVHELDLYAGIMSGISAFWTGRTSSQVLTLLHSLSRSRALHQHDCAFRRDRQGAPSQVSHREGLHASTYIAHLVSVAAAPGTVLGAPERLSRPDKVSSENPATYSSRGAEPQCRATPEWARSYGNEPVDAGDAPRSVLEGPGSCVASRTWRPSGMAAAGWPEAVSGTIFFCGTPC